MYKFWIASALCLSIIAASPVSAQTGSGRPEITVPGASVAIKPLLIGQMLNRGYSVVADTPYMITFEKPITSMAGYFLFGTRAGGPPNSRISCTILESGGSTRVVADMAVIANPGTGFERRNDMNSGSDAVEMQQILNQLSPPAPAALPTGTLSPGVRDGEFELSGNK